MKTILLALVASILVTGCKKAQRAEATPSPDNNSTSTQGAAPGNPAANQPAIPPPPTPTVDTTKAFADVNTALKANDYKKAADTLLILQREKQLTEQQSMAVRGQMVQLQQAIAGGLAKGDPSAKAAADALRAQASGN